MISANVCHWLAVMRMYTLHDYHSSGSCRGSANIA